MSYGWVVHLTGVHGPETLYPNPTVAACGVLPCKRCACGGIRGQN